MRVVVRARGGEAQANRAISRDLARSRAISRDFARTLLKPPPTHPPHPTPPSLARFLSLSRFLSRARAPSLSPLSYVTPHARARARARTRARSYGYAFAATVNVRAREAVEAQFVCSLLHHKLIQAMTATATRLPSSSCLIKQFRISNTTHTHLAATATRLPSSSCLMKQFRISNTTHTHTWQLRLRVWRLLPGPGARGGGQQQGRQGGHVFAVAAIIMIFIMF